MGRGTLKPHEEKLRLIISSNIKQLLNDKGLKAIDLQRGTNIPQSSISEYLNAKATPNLGKVEQIANFFGVKKSDIDPSLITGWDEPATSSTIGEKTISSMGKLTKTQQEQLLELSKYDLDEAIIGTIELMSKADEAFRDKVFSYANFEYFQYEKEQERKNSNNRNTAG